ncbi:MAG: DUF192 domain-containing protein [bacterium]|nr:DUF192 domain-containing protein [bacterium]
MIRTKQIIRLLFALLLASISFAAPELPQKVTIGKVTAWLEISDDTDEIVQGLSDRTELAPDHGMLFVFPKPQRHSFWMYHCYFDIDLAYLDAQGRILEIQRMFAEPLSTPPALLKTYPSKTDSVQYVIEMEAGWFERNNIRPGDYATVAKFTSKFTPTEWDRLTK